MSATSSTFEKIVEDHVKAGFQCLWICTPEEERCVDSLKTIAANMGYGLTVWNEATGFSHEQEPGQTKNLFMALKNGITAAISGPAPARRNAPVIEQPAFVVFKDIFPLLMGKSDQTRQLKNMVELMQLNTETTRRPYFIIQNAPSLPSPLAHCVTPIDFPLPDAAALEAILDERLMNIRDESKRQCSPELRYAVVSGMQGLTSSEAVNCLSLCLRRHLRMCPEIVGTIEETKANALKGHGVLTYVRRDKLRPADQIGGYEELKKAMVSCAKVYTPQAAEAELDMPRGIVLGGIPGVGKSVAAEVIASILWLPLVKMDFSAIFSSLVGASEAKMRDTIRTIEAMGGCVLQIDEADKALAGSNSSSVSDSGVTRRVFGQLLTWMASKNDRTFVVMTMNDPTCVPSETLRRGRIDAIWWVDLPNEAERRQILTIHLTRRKVPVDTFAAAEWRKFIKASEDMTGGELEEAVKMSRLASFDQDPSKKGLPNADQLLEALEMVSKTKITVVDPEGIKKLREFGLTKGRPVSAAAAIMKTKSGRQLNLDLPVPEGEL